MLSLKTTSSDWPHRCQGICFTGLFFFYNQKSVLPFLFTSRRKWRRWNVKRSAKITGDVHVGLSSSDVYSIVALFELESWGLLFFYLEEIKYWTCMYSQKTWSLSYYVPLASSFVRSAVLCLRTEPLCPPALGLSRKLRSSSRVELVAGNKERSASSSEMWWWKCANKHTQRTHAGARSCTGKKKKKKNPREHKSVEFITQWSMIVSMETGAINICCS